MLTILFGILFLLQPIFVLSLKKKEIKLEKACKILDFFDEKIVFFKNGNFYLIDSKNNKKIIVNDFIMSCWCLHQNYFYVCDNDVTFKCFDFEGNVLFSEPLEAFIIGEIFIDDNNVYFMLTNQVICCYSLEGKLKWISRKLITYNLMCKSKILIDKYIYVLDRNQKLHVLDKRNGEIIYSFNNNINDFFIFDDKIIITYDDGCYFANLNNLIELTKISDDGLLVNECKINFINGVITVKINGKNMVFQKFKITKESIVLYNEKYLFVFHNNSFDEYYSSDKINDVFYKNDTLLVAI